MKNKLHVLPQSKRIAPTDNMRPKSDDAKKRHRWLKDDNKLMNKITMFKRLELHIYIYIYNPTV